MFRLPEKVSSFPAVVLGVCVFTQVWSENKVVLLSLSLFGDIPVWGMVRVTRLPPF